MSRFENILSHAKAVGSSVGDKTKELVIISNKKLKLVECDTKAEKLFAELGKRFFEDYSDDCGDEETKYIVEKIEILLAEIENIKTDIDILKGNLN